MPSRRRASTAERAASCPPRGSRQACRTTRTGRGATGPAPAGLACADDARRRPRSKKDAGTGGRAQRDSTPIRPRRRRASWKLSDWTTSHQGASGRPATRSARAGRRGPAARRRAGCRVPGTPGRRPGAGLTSGPAPALGRAARRPGRPPPPRRRRRGTRRRPGGSPSYPPPPGPRPVPWSPARTSAGRGPDGCHTQRTNSRRRHIGASAPSMSGEGRT